jgi:hypothetical protein
MNYTIYAKDNQENIGADIITGSPIPLLDLKSLDQSNLHQDLFSKVQKGSLVIALNGVDVDNQVEIIGTVIQLFRKHKKDKILEDYNERIRIKFLELTDPQEIEIDRPYNNRIIMGNKFYRKTRASLLLKVKNGEMTSENLFQIDKNITNAKNCLIYGDWKTAQYFIEESVPEGAYTQDIKDNFLQEIKNNIADLY